MTEYELRIRQEAAVDFTEAVARAAAARRNAGDARTIRAVGVRWHGWALGHGVAPLAARRADLDRFLSESDSRNRNRLRWALRAILSAGDVSAEDHGLGLGIQSHRLDQIDDPRLREVVRRVLASAPGRTGVWRSGVAKLLAWASSSGIHPLDVTAPDLDGYRDWIRQVGGADGELMVIARQFVRARWQLVLERP
jgi:hypothetical protein